ncbi:hypothetical protein EJ04DRAFT_598105 [Polyplosphaeria fusca]|uniref:Uncharacterized protein n=1 Tax=Polyplosphaeria fusca TaxID=682080 RepID=A0A9P4QI67_9PLEO|nr:hypothetical protein EJ04DRAFT_598105 [Polyplosphaeria fusca]
MSANKSRASGNSSVEAGPPQPPLNFSAFRDTEQGSEGSDSDSDSSSSPNLEAKSRPRDFINTVIADGKYQYDEAFRNSDRPDWKGAPSLDEATTSGYSRLRFDMSGFKPIDSLCRKPRLQSNNFKALGEAYIKEGVVWKIIGWRKVCSQMEYLVEYRSPENACNPGMADVFATALVSEDDMPHDLLLNYSHVKEFEVANLGHSNGGEKTMDHVEAFLVFAWNSNGKPLFTSHLSWDKLTSKASMIKETSSDVQAILDGIMVLVRWKDGKETWESGRTLVNLLTLSRFLRLWPGCVLKMRSKWERIKPSSKDPRVKLIANSIEDVALDMLADRMAAISIRPELGERVRATKPPQDDSIPKKSVSRKGGPVPQARPPSASAARHSYLNPLKRQVNTKRVTGYIMLDSNVHPIVTEQPPWRNTNSTFDHNNADKHRTT